VAANLSPQIKIIETGRSQDGCPYQEGIVQFKEQFEFLLPDAAGNSVTIPEFQMAYSVYGNPDNPPIFVPSTLTSSHRLAHGDNPKGVSTANSWWTSMVGPGKPIDTDHFCVIGIDWLGGCFGSTGPACINPETGEKYDFDFPQVTLQDNVKAQKMCLEELGFNSLAGVCSGSLGAMCAQQWMVDYPEFAGSCYSLAGTWGHRKKDLIGHDLMRQAYHMVFHNCAKAMGKKAAASLGLKMMRVIANTQYVPIGAEAFDEGRIEQPEDMERVLHYMTSTMSWINNRSAEREPAVHPISHLYILRMNSLYGLAHMGPIERIASALERVDESEKLNSTPAGRTVSLDENSREYILRILMGLENLGEEKLGRMKRSHYHFFSYGGDLLYNPQRPAELVTALKMLGFRHVRFHHIKGAHGHDGFAEAKNTVIREMSRGLKTAAHRWRLQQGNSIRHARDESMRLAGREPGA